MSSVWSALEGGVVGLAVAEAGAAVVEPALEPARQKAEQDSQARILEMHELARLVAQALSSTADVQDHVERNGYSQDEFLAAVQLELHAPGAAEALALFRRNQIVPSSAQISSAQLHHAYAKSGLEAQWWPALDALATLELTPAQIALGIVRSLIADPGLLAVTLDTTGGVVPAYPVSAIDAAKMAAAGGFDLDMLRVLVGTVGLPPSVQQLASMTFRGIIQPGDFNRGILEGDARPEWAPYWLEQAREILTAHTYVEARLRNWLTTDAQMYAKTAQWGMSQADTDLLFKTTGRPIPVHRITQGTARGGSYNGPTDQIADDYLQSLRESNIRPEWFELAFLSEQYTWPSYFVLEKLVPKAISVERAAEILTYAGWEPDLALATAQMFGASSSTAKGATAAQLGTQYEAGTISPADFAAKLRSLNYTDEGAADVIAYHDAKPLASARTAVLGKLRAGVAGGAITEAQALEQLGKLNPPIAAAAQLVSLWLQENEIEQLRSSPA